MIGPSSRVQDVLFPKLDPEFLVTMEKKWSDEADAFAQGHSASLRKQNGLQLYFCWHQKNSASDARSAIDSSRTLLERTISFRSHVEQLGLPRIDFKCAIATSCIMEFGPNSGRLGLDETIHHLDSLFEVVHSSAYDCLISSATFEVLTEKDDITESELEPLMRLGTSAPLPIYILI